MVANRDGRVRAVRCEGLRFSPLPALCVLRLGVEPLVSADPTTSSRDGSPCCSADFPASAAALPAASTVSEWGSGGDCAPGAGGALL